MKNNKEIQNRTITVTKEVWNKLVLYKIKGGFKTMSQAIKEALK